jgi:hypothetical protein
MHATKSPHVGEHDRLCGQLQQKTPASRSSFSKPLQVKSLSGGDLSQSSISMAAHRGEQIAEIEGYSLLNELKLKNRRASLYLQI